MKKLLILLLLLSTLSAAWAQSSQKPTAQTEKKVKKQTAKAKPAKSKKKPASGKNDPSVSGSGMTVEQKDRPKLDEPVRNEAPAVRQRP